MGDTILSCIVYKWRDEEERIHKELTIAWNYPNNHISPELTEHKKGTTTYDIGNPGSGLGQGQKYGGVRMI